MAMSTCVSNPPRRHHVSGALLAGVSCITAGVAFAVYTQAVLTMAGAIAAVLILRWLVYGKLPLWQALMALSLTGFIVLNYGFENLIVGRIAGIPLLVGEFAMLGGLMLAVHNRGLAQLRKLMQDPAVLCLIVLFVLAALHLLVDVPRFGLYAFRDASTYFEAIFIAAGYYWANERNGIRRFVQCLLIIFVLNAVYSFTLPWGEDLQAMSPASGVFQPIPVLGQYQQSAMYLAAGTIFCAWIKDYTVGWRRRLLLSIAAIQVCGLAVMQSRALSVGILTVLALLLVLGENNRLRASLSALGTGVVAIVALLLVVSAAGIAVRGRVGEINGDFLRQYALSVFSLDSSNHRLAKDDDRLDWLQQVWRGTTVNAVTFIVGQGFGLPLIDFQAEDGMPVRQPHDAAAAVFGRLGVAGLSVWVLFQLILFKRFLRTLKAARDRETHDLALWLFVFYALGFVLSMVQPALEFSHYAVPLYFILGFSLNVMHRCLEQSQKYAPTLGFLNDYKDAEPCGSYNKLG